jgi:prepilin-type N-terminal cleavage/methylation domain-containing protein
VKDQRGFTLLEVLVGLVILGLAVVTLIQLASQGLRLVGVSGEHQQAVLVADRIVRETVAIAEGVETGREGPFTWERRISPVPVPDELNPPSGPTPQLLAVSIIVRWGQNHSLGLATLRVVPRPPSAARP